MVFVRSVNVAEKRVIEEFLRSNMQESGARGVVIGLSGGLDSAVCAALCAGVLPKEDVLLVFMPGDTTPEEDFGDVDRIAEHLGLRLHTIPIGETTEALISQISQQYPMGSGSSELNPSARINLKPRVRMTILFYLANLSNLLVIGTSNKSELLAGYFTKYGDGASDLALIGDLYKTQVFQLGELLDLPAWLLRKTPSPGLSPGVNDEDELGISYSLLDQLLAGFDLGYDDDYVARKVGADPAEARRIRRMIHSTIHKRRFPRIPKLGLNTVGIDRKEF